MSEAFVKSELKLLIRMYVAATKRKFSSDIITSEQMEELRKAIIQTFEAYDAMRTKLGLPSLEDMIDYVPSDPSVNPDADIMEAYEDIYIFRPNDSLLTEDR